MVVGQNRCVSHREAEVVRDEAYEPRLVKLPICPDYEAPRHAIIEHATPRPFLVPGPDRCGRKSRLAQSADAAAGQP